MSVTLCLSVKHDVKGCGEAFLVTEVVGENIFSALHALRSQLPPHPIEVAQRIADQQLARVRQDPFGPLRPLGGTQVGPPR
jgi:hypothetical protein